MARVERQKLWVGHDCRVPRARASLLVPAARGVELRPQPANVVLGRVGHELRQPDGPANGRHRYGRLATRAVREHGQQEDSCDDEALERDLTDATLCESGTKVSRCCGSRTKSCAPPSGKVTFVPGYGRMCVDRRTLLHRHAAAANSTAAPQSSTEGMRAAVDAGANASAGLDMPAKSLRTSTALAPRRLASKKRDISPSCNPHRSLLLQSPPRRSSIHGATCW